MDPISISPSDVAGVAGLLGVRADGHLYVGKSDASYATLEKLEALGPGYVALRDAYELLVQHRQQQNGAVGMVLIPVPISPFTGPTKIIVRMSALLDLSACADMVDINRAMTGASGILLPGMGSPRAERT